MIVCHSVICFHVQEIEKPLECLSGSHCTLYAFLMEYIKDVFLCQIHVDISNSLCKVRLAVVSASLPWFLIPVFQFLPISNIVLLIF